MPVTKGTELKKSSPVKVTRNTDGDYTDKNNRMHYGFSVEMKNGDVGEYNANDPEKPKFKVGEECEYYIDIVTSSKPDSDWSKKVFRYNYTAAGFGGGSYKKKTPEEQKSILYQVIMKHAYFFKIEIIKHSDLINKEVFDKLIVDIYSDVIKIIEVDGKINETLAIEYSSSIKIMFVIALAKILEEGKFPSTTDYFIKLVTNVYNLIKHERFAPKTA